MRSDAVRCGVIGSQELGDVRCGIPVRYGAVRGGPVRPDASDAAPVLLDAVRCVRCGKSCDPCFFHDMDEFTIVSSGEA